MAGILVLLAALLAQASEETDVIVTKDGRRLRGVIEKETDEIVVLRIIIKGPKGETVISTTNDVPRDEIAEIVRMGDAAREKEKDRAQAFADRHWKQAQRHASIRVTKATVEGRDGFTAAGDLFEVRTTCDEDFARETCDALQQAYEGYLRHFKLRGKATRRLPVLILADREQYDEYVRRAYGQAIGNPALYDVRANLIVAYNCVQREEEARIRASIREQRKEIDRYEQDVAAVEKRNDEAIKEARRKIIAEATEIKNRLRREGRATNAAIQEVDRQKDQRLDAVTQIGRAADKELADLRAKADKATAQCSSTIRRNEAVLRAQNRAMFELLFHECFHAFARNRLYSGKEIPRWLNEGMASYFEMSVVEGEELIHGAPNTPMLRLFREQASKGGLPDLATVLRDDGNMFLVTHEGNIDRSNLAYAVCWATAHYLTSRLSRDQMDDYVSRVATGADPADALSKVLGQPLGKIDEAVREHVAALR